MLNKSKNKKGFITAANHHHNALISCPFHKLPLQTFPEEESVFQDDGNVSQDDQEERPRVWRSAPPSPVRERRGISSSLLSLHTEEFLELLSTAQTRRLEEQRAELPPLRPRHTRHFSFPSYRQLSLPSDDKGILSELQHRRGSSWAIRSQKKKPPTIKIPAQEKLYNTILDHQAQRMEDQRCSPPLPSSAADLFEILFRVQGNRMDEQRVEFPSPLENACS
ncbi:G- -signaling modulator 1-like [Pelobates cultripes]|uniref:G- -signaling modulator 1-like n=1 Tax=Pelobates cultripes TaxID=61616 RepID=A0AAD1WI75_PELCU|nr:G- -signaling modulator 1-like [Pelobates cultripes]